MLGQDSFSCDGSRAWKEVERGRAVMGLDMGLSGVLQHPPITCFYSHAANQGRSWGNVKDASFPPANLPLWSVHGQLGPDLAG